VLIRLPVGYYTLARLAHVLWKIHPDGQHQPQQDEGSDAEDQLGAQGFPLMSIQLSPYHDKPFGRKVKPLAAGIIHGGSENRVKYPRPLET
jgi:hypothetical protein